MTLFKHCLIIYSFEDLSLDHYSACFLVKQSNVTPLISTCTKRFVFVVWIALAIKAIVLGLVPPLIGLNKVIVTRKYGLLVDGKVTPS